MGTVAIERGLRGLRSVPGCVVEDGPTLYADVGRWVVTFSLRHDTASQFIGKTTRWCALIEADYPFGGIAIHPAAQGGIIATFAHQCRNTASQGRQVWRGGKLCLDSPFGGEQRLTLDRDPTGDAETRLRWHVERTLLWLHRAGTGQLLATGDPFEVPALPYAAARTSRVVHDETANTFDAWCGREGTFGRAQLGFLPDMVDMTIVESFVDSNNASIREWAGRRLETCDDVVGLWWLWPTPIVLAPWQGPSTWGELRRIAEGIGLDVDGMLRWLLASARDAKTRNILLLGYPVPMRVGASASEIHWDAIWLPRVGADAGRPPNGFRANDRGWWQRDRYGTFADSVALEYLPTENWSPGRLQARGRLPSAVRDLRIALVGIGALGSALAEMLVRAGTTDIALVDNDLLEAGNVCRHSSTLVDVGRTKVQIVAQRLRQISPAVRVTEFSEKLWGNAKAIIEKFDEYDVIVDCTSSDEALMLLGTAWWSIPRIFASFSLGYEGKRLFSFGTSGHRFPEREFAASMRPWLEHEAKAWSSNDEILEGAGCWSPIFPARHNDVVLAAATCVKELETLVAERPRSPRFRVFTQSMSEDGFEGLVRQGAPPAATPSAS